jgi:hypothetical protein
MPESKNTRPSSRRAAATKTQPAAVEPINRDEEDIAAKDARIAATLDLKDLGDSERAFLATCQKLYRRHSGCTSPFEEFFWSLVLDVERGHWPTPDDVARELETFKDDFDDMSRWARYFLEAYPEVPAKDETEQPKEAAHA